MRRLVQSVLLAAVIVVTGCLASACAQAASGATGSDSPSASAPATATAPPPTSASPAPSTVAPSTVFTTITPTTPATTPASSSPASSSVSGTDLIWLWLILGALALLGIILWATRSSSRPLDAAPAAPPPGTATWRSRAADAYAQGAALDRAVRTADSQGAFAEPAGDRWYDIRVLADDLAQKLYTMQETAPNEERRAQVGQALGSLEAVRYAVDADRTITVEDTDESQDAILQSSLLALESSLNALRVPEGPYR